jgi:hypothetical protein
MTDSVAIESEEKSVVIQSECSRRSFVSDSSFVIRRRSGQFVN